MEKYNANFVDRRYSSIYWLIVILLYVTVSTVSNSWNETWLLLVGAGIVYSILAYSDNPVNH